MKKIFTILFCLSISIMFAQSPTEEMLIKRIEALEMRVSLLEKNAGNINSNPVIVASKEDCDKWKQIEIGMKISKVVSILGEPSRITTTGIVDLYSYTPINSTNETYMHLTGSVSFYRSRVNAIVPPNCTE